MPKSHPWCPLEFLQRTPAREGRTACPASTPRSSRRERECGARKRIARRMRAAGRRGVSRRRFVTTTVRSEMQSRPRTSFSALFGGEAEPALGGGHHLHPDMGRLPLPRRRSRCVQPSYRGLGHGTHLRTELVLQAFDMATHQRRASGVIHHSDQGCQCTALAFGQRCKQAGVRPSTGSVGDCFDNAMCESFFAILECELLDWKRFATHPEARLAVFGFIEGWHNPWRRHGPRLRFTRSFREAA